MNFKIQIFQRSFELTSFRILLLFGLVIFILYGNSLGHGYNLDDELVTSTDRQAHPLIEKGIAGIPEIFTTNYAVNSEQNYEYRPITLCTFAIEKSFFRSSDHAPQISHFIQLLFYLLLAWVIFSTLSLMLHEHSIALSIGITLLFIALPIHTEVVNSLKNRDEMLSLIFSLMALRASVKFIDKPNIKQGLFICFFFLLALLSKKTSMPFLVLIPLALWYFKKPPIKTMVFVLLGLVSGRLLFTFMRTSLLEKTIDREFSMVENPLFKMRFLDRIPVFFDSVAWYLKQTFLPLEMHSYYGLGGFPIVGFNSMGFFLALFVILSLVGIVILGIRNKQWNGISFGLLFFFLCIGGAANLIFPMVGIVADRLVFTASLGLVIALFLGINAWLTRKPIKNFNWLMAVLAVYFIYLSGLVIQRNGAWKDRITLFRTDAHQFKSAKANALLGQESQFLANEAWLNPSGNEEQLYDYILLAKSSYEHSLEIYPDYVKVLNNLASLESNFTGQNDLAVMLSTKAIALDSKYEEAYNTKFLSMLKNYSAWFNLRSYAQQFGVKTKGLTYFNMAPFALFKNFEERGKLFLSDGMNPKSIEGLTSFAEGMERINTQLASLNPRFHDQVSASLNDLYSGSRSSHNILDSLRGVLCRINKLPSDNKEINIYTQKLKSQLFDFTKAFEAEFPKAKVGTLLDTYMMQIQDYQSMIDYHKYRLLTGKGKALDCIQIGNAYLNLGEPKKAMKALNKGYTLIEKSTHPNKENELQRLRIFMDSIRPKQP